MWKKSYVNPIHKNGSKNDIKNYRPISVTSCIPKILDAIVANRHSEFLVNKIIGEQHGFTKNKSTLSKFISLY